MKIAEIYKSIQGEGFLAGTESVFVRASGCNLRCQFCDTPFASWYPEGDDLSVDEIVQKITALDCAQVVLTGGEPMLFSELIPLTQRLRQRQLHITIETAGTLSLPVECDLMSISPKTENSTPSDLGSAWENRHRRTRWAPDVIRQLVANFPYQIKFVVASPKDLPEIQQYLQHFDEIDRGRVLLMPEGTDPTRLDQITSWLEPYCSEHCLQLCPRQQITWFGATRGT